ncbi:MAG TPA: DUF1416 domain-containing protein [Mycobacteriales bacterium]|jgi:uncharacterized GH25 family protein|nr:DUF1416 domain-containing protein [Mycobacteriales bacterium]
MCGAPAQNLDRSGIPDGETVVQGRVVRDGQPVTGAYVRLLGESDEFTAEVVTSAAGVFRFFVKPGSWTLRVLAPGSLSGTAKVSVSEGDVEETEISVA